MALSTRSRANGAQSNTRAIREALSRVGPIRMVFDCPSASAALNASGAQPIADVLPWTQTPQNFKLLESGGSMSVHSSRRAANSVFSGVSGAAMTTSLVEWGRAECSGSQVDREWIRSAPA